MADGIVVLVSDPEEAEAARRLAASVGLRAAVEVVGKDGATALDLVEAPGLAVAALTPRLSPITRELIVAHARSRGLRIVELPRFEQPEAVAVVLASLGEPRVQPPLQVRLPTMPPWRARTEILMAGAEPAPEAEPPVLEELPAHPTRTDERPLVGRDSQPPAGRDSSPPAGRDSRPPETRQSGQTVAFETPRSATAPAQELRPEGTFAREVRRTIEEIEHRLFPESVPASAARHDSADDFDLEGFALHTVPGIDLRRLDDDEPTRVPPPDRPRLAAGAPEPPTDEDRRRRGLRTPTVPAMLVPPSRVTEAPSLPPPPGRRTDPVPTQVPKGRIEDQDLALVLGSLIARSATGALELVRRGVEKRVFFEDGDIVGAASNAPGDGILDLLVREGALAASDAARVAEAGRKSGARDEGMLLSLLPLPANERALALARRAEAIVCSLLGWTHGELRFSERAPRAAERVLMPPAPWLVLEGVRRRYGLDRLLLLLPEETELQRSGDADDVLRALELGDEERRLLHHIGGGASVKDALERGGALGELGTLQLLWAAIALGALSAEVKAPEQAAVAPEAHREAVQRKRELCDEGDYFELLGARRSDSAHELRRAYERACAALSPERIRDPALRDDLLTIRRMLDEAFAVLGDESLRADYRAALAHPERLP